MSTSSVISDYPQPQYINTAVISNLLAGSETDAWENKIMVQASTNEHRTLPHTTSPRSGFTLVSLADFTLRGWEIVRLGARTMLTRHARQKDSVINQQKKLNRWLLFA